MPRNIPIIAEENIYPHPPIDNVDDEYYESIVCLWDSTSLCVEEKFITGNTSDMECYGEGDPVVVVPRNWPPRDWNGANPRKAIIYLDDLIDFEYDTLHVMDDPVLGNSIDPLTEIQNILMRFSDDINNVIILGSYWAAYNVFDMVNKEGNRPSKRVAKFIDQLRVTCAFKFVVTRGERYIRESSASRFICY